ncbi:hypothetical protein CPJCM30710_17350 [Clostridium polyendosporum]|uniref:Uncharacterized protein n=1 Tax=Clostridium polyendosporum TaxID=69208 RepID=A0A919VEE6_9CLOT|nr:clostri-philic family protein [Clostridium polyendosporum]GIM29069.1 hypothetical protein CPJCM30710_17350 [Clostridium polyendosporum]
MSKNHVRNNVTDDGQRRQRLHKHQDNRGTKKNPPEYENLNGDPIK